VKTMTRTALAPALGLAAVLAIASPAMAADGGAEANLKPVALSGVVATGTGTVEIKGTALSFTLAAKGLLADAPHAAHIHFGAEARNECPAATDDASGDGTINTTEGAPAYGEIVVSLTKTGDTSPD
jgi:Cu/Zn superoxide dismutase